MTPVCFAKVITTKVDEARMGAALAGNTGSGLHR